ncbi:hypothetical protein DRJ48_03120 [Candidatus Woesearchaeota archaeon]|nr:ABC transporter ATP-binding protein [Candidatus Woesearchaeota archaeon]RLE42646.1 MAG: hypothetical protein DRJ48_03120 [Candidatus Woesearchaeota archaeon]
MNTENVIEVKGLSVSFGKQRVIHGLSLEVRHKEIFGITGVSGVGKTTLLNAIVGLIQPDRGEINYSSIILGEKHPRPLKLRKHLRLIKNYIGYSTQDPSFYEELTPIENLDFFGAMYSVPRRIRQKNISILLELMGLREVGNKIAKSLSGGMRKRLDIACALIHNPKILFLDEPTSDLDPILRGRVWSVVKRVNQLGTTVVVSSHFLNEIEQLCSRIGILHNGRIIRVVSNKKQTKKGHVWLEVVIKPKQYEQLIGELLKNKSLNPENINYDKKSELLLVRVSHEGKFKELIHSTAKKLGVSITSIKRTGPLKEIFMQTVQ